MKISACIIALAVAAVGCSNASSHPAQHAAPSPITKQQVLDAQKAWGDGIVAIGKVFQEKGDYQAKASEHIKTLYAYEQGEVLFKPTLAAKAQFRPTFGGALSYFVKGKHAEDKGFAIKPWSKVRFGEQQILTDSDSAIAMGNYYFTPVGSTEETKVEFTFNYMKDKTGALRINTHHSSLPYAPSPAAISKQEVLDAQKAWGDGIVAIGKVLQEKGDYQARASDHIKTLYAYEQGEVLFKPTLAAKAQFRPTFGGALSYFVKGEHAEDKGFAIKPWSKVRFGEQQITIDADSAMAMGNYYFTPVGSSEETKVEFTFAYMKDSSGKLRINVHHSSLPFSP